MIYEYEEAMEQSYITSLVKAFKKNITDGFFNFIILDCINEKISDYEEMWSFAKTKGFKVIILNIIIEYFRRYIESRDQEIYRRDLRNIECFKRLLNIFITVNFSIWNQSFFNKSVITFIIYKIINNWK